jgi:hypothetical protein
MVQQDAAQRPGMEAVLSHPLWWSDAQRLEFLCDVSDRCAPRRLLLLLRLGSGRRWRQEQAGAPAGAAQLLPGTVGVWSVLALCR